MPRSARTVRTALLAAATALAALVAPARAADPTALVATRSDGTLVRVTLTGRVATVEELVPGSPTAFRVPTQALGRRVSFVLMSESPKGDRYDVGILDAETGKTGIVSRDGRSGFLLQSANGYFRYVMKTGDDGFFHSLVSTDNRGRVIRTLVKRPRTVAAELSGAGLTGDGRYVYLAQTPLRGTSTLFGVDVVTGAVRTVRPTVAMPHVYNVVVSPNGTTLAVSYTDATDAAHVALVDVASGEARELVTYTLSTASAFTADGTGVILTAPIDALPVGVGLEPWLALADVATGAVTPILGTAGLFQAVPVA